MKISVIVESYQSLMNLTKQNIPVTQMFELKKYVQNIKPEIDSYEEVRNARVKELGEPILKEGKETGMYNIMPDNLETYNKDMAELKEKESEVKVPVIKQGELLEHFKKLQVPPTLTTADLIALEWLIVE